ncbi:mediator of RNA polymerase II transcription subunit 26, partial [Astyanax mexicanus]
TMTTASTTPQQLRDRLLQAVDEQSHETRLGKLINDLRRGTRDEDLAKRAKKLLRTWQKLIEPQQNEKLPKELSSTANGCIQAPSLPVTRSVQGATEMDRKLVLHNSYTSNTDRVQLINHKCEQKAEDNPSHKLKVSKTSAYGQISALSSASASLPVKASTIKFQLPSPDRNKQSNAHAVLRTSVLQQYGQRDRAVTKKEQQKLQNHHTASSPRTAKPVGATKRPAPFAGSDSEMFSALPLNSSVHGIHTESQQTKEAIPHYNDNEPLENKERALEQMHNLQNKSKSLKRPHPGLLSEVTNVESEKDVKPFEAKRRKHQSRDYAVSQEGHSAEDSKSARLKNRKLTFDPFTQQIRPSAVNQIEEQHGLVVDLGESDYLKQSPSAASPSTLHKTNWKDLSQNEIVKYYLNLQNNLLKTSGSQTPGSHTFMTEYLKREEDHMMDSNKVCLLVPSVSETDLPGKSRDVVPEDLNRIHDQHWSGVNGCYDSKGNWYGWTDCISLDTYGDGSKLNILPYVCID